MLQRAAEQAARTLHFIAAVLLVAFVLVHVFEVIVTGLVNNLRSTITGYRRLPKCFEQRRERRRLLRAGFAVAAAGALAGCDALSHDDTAVRVLKRAETLTNAVHRVLGRRAMVQEFSPGDIAPAFRPNSTTMPAGDAYAALMAKGFADWRLKVDGLVTQPLELSLAQGFEPAVRESLWQVACVKREIKLSLKTSGTLI